MLPWDRTEYLIVDAGKLAGMGAHSYSPGNATTGSDEGTGCGSCRGQMAALLQHHARASRNGAAAVASTP